MSRAGAALAQLVQVRTLNTGTPGSTPWWRQEGNLAKIYPVHQKSFD